MADTTIDLWPSDFGSPEIEYPDVILKQQAALLGDKTQHLVEAEVHSPDNGLLLRDKILKTFYLVAPALAGYRYRLFTIQYDVNPYPVIITGYSDAGGRICQTKTEFLTALKDLFASDETRRVIASLLAQSQA